MFIPGIIRTMRRRHLGVLVAMIWLALAAGAAVGREGNGRQNQSQGGQQNGQPCPAQTTQNGQNGQSGQNSQQPQQQQSGQTQQNGQAQPNANCNQQPAPLFGGSMNIRKSNQSTDSAALGFNGVDPNGQVQQAFLNAQPTPQSLAKAQAMAAYRPAAADLTAFEQAGGLTQGATPATAGVTPPSAH
jgi:hypothetical protein